MASISRAGASALMPDQYVSEIIKSATAQSVLLSLARKVRMATGVYKQPVLSVLPQAQWISPRDTGHKPTGTAEWENVVLTAEEMAVIVPIPESVLDDTNTDIWGEVTPLVAQEFGRLLDLAGIFGAGPFAAGDSVVEKAIAAGNKVAIGDAITVEPVGRAADFADYTSAALALVENDGFIPNGWAAATSVRAKLRNLRNADGDLIYASSVAGGQPATLHGESIMFSRNGGWDAAHTTGALLVTADWTKAIVGIRQDVTVKLLTEATLTDGAGNVTLSLAEQDHVALRCVFRVAFATANPVNALNTVAANRSPFAVLQADATP